MRVQSLALLSLLALTLLCSRAASAAETITFEEMSPDGPGTGGVIPVLNFYAAQGVIFRAVALDYSRGIAIPNFAHSGTKGIETCYATEFCSAPIEMTFTQAQTHVKLFVGFSGSLSQAITVIMRAFATDGSEVGQATATLAASTSATPIQTPMEITANSATIVRVAVGIEIDGVPSFTGGLAVDDVEFDTAGPQPPCTALQDPTVSISQPVNNLTVQFNQFPLAFIVNSGDPFAVTRVTDSGSGQSQTVSYPGFTGTFGPTSVNGLLVPGLSTLTVAVTDCRGSAQASVSINFTPIATDEQFHVLGFEATQVIQNIPSGVPLIADKPTVVRVYLRVTGSTPQITNVRGTLFAYRPANSFFDVGLPLDGSVHSSNSITVDQSNDLKVERLSLDKSLNFDLPADWITQGAVHFELKLDVDNSPSSPVLIPCNGCNLKFGTGGAIFSTFHPMPTFNLRIIGLNYTTNPQVAANNPPRALDFALLESWVRRTFPAGQFTVTTNTVIADNVFPFSCNTANAQLAAIRATEVAGGVDPRTHYIGLVINTGGFMRGCASGIPDSPDSTVVASSPTGNTTGPNRPVNVSGDTDGSFGDWYGGHELAHTFGRKHPGFCNGNSSDDSSFPNPNGQISDNLQTHVGLDRGDPANAIPRIVISPFKFDIMTYCNQPQWFSAYNYIAVRRRFNDENNASTNDFAPMAGGGAGGAGAQAGPDNAKKDEDFVSIVASVNLTRQTGVIRYVDHVRRTTLPVSAQNKLASIRFKSKAGKVLGTFPTWVREDSDLMPGEDRTGLVQVVVPVNRSAASLELVLQGKVVSRRVISKHRPVVKKLRISKLATLYAGKRGRVLTWIGLDRDDDKLTYLVQINSGGNKWDTIASALSVNKLTLTEDQLKAPQPQRVRVIANDGFNVSEPAIIEFRSALSDSPGYSGKTTTY